MAQKIESQLYWVKVNCGPHTVKIQDFFVKINILRLHSSFAQVGLRIGQKNSPPKQWVHNQGLVFHKEDWVFKVSSGFHGSPYVSKNAHAWSYEDMMGLDTDIVVHRLPMKEDYPPAKQKVRRMRPYMSEKIKAEVMKQFDACFLAVTSYPQWVANVVPVLKKDGKVHMCVDYRDLNRESPKDDFPLPHIDVLVDNTAQHKIFSFMDGFSGYNQIKMAPEDMEKTTFITQQGTFCYKVMPFGLKNVGATYQ